MTVPNSAPARHRRGQATVEFSLAVLVLLTLVLGVLDVGRALLVQGALTEMAAAGARYASLSLVPQPVAAANDDPNAPLSSALPPPDRWTTQVIDAATQAAISARARAAGFALDASAATIGVQLLDGGSAAGQRVRVTVNYQYIPLSSLFVGGRSLQMSSANTLLILR